MRTPIVACAAMLVSLALFALAVQPAYAANREELERNYQAALINYEELTSEHSQNSTEILAVNTEIEQTQASIDEAREQLDATASALYRHTIGENEMYDYVLGSSSFQEAVMRYDTYERIEAYYRDRMNNYAKVKNNLSSHMQKLLKHKLDLELQIAEARHAAEDAEAALLAIKHTDGAKFHQAQGVGNNCGATAFIVGVNTLLGENRFLDNVAVWRGPGFNGDSTADLAYRGGIWLVANGLSPLITIQTVPGDIHTTQQMRSELEQGHMVIVSSGPGSTWQRADGTQAPAGSFPDGHWIVFYGYDNGVYYANDSSVDASKGAGCPYTEAQMQQWLDGRGNHFACVLKTL